MIREALLVGLALAACGGGETPEVPAFDAAARDAPALDAALDAPALDAPPDPDPWTAATGAVIDGATLADGWTELRALPAPLAIEGGWTDSLFAVPDGRHLRFAYAPMDFFQFFHTSGATQIVSGPQLLGTTGKTFKLFDATLTATGWTISPEPVASSDPAIVEASPATNASNDLIVFTRFDAATGRSRLYYASNAAGAWSAPDLLSINSKSCNDDNAKLVGELATGVTLYFESNRAEPAGTSDACGQRTLYATTYADGAFTPVVAVPGIATADSDDSQPFITADQQTLYWTGIRAGRYGLYGATRGTDGSYGAIHEVITPTTTPPVAGKLVLVGEASIVVRPEGELLYLMCGVAYDEHGGATYFDADNIRLVPCVARRPRAALR